MKRCLLLLGSFLLSVLAWPAYAGDRPQSTENSPGTVRLRSVRLLGIDSARLSLGLRLAVTPSQDATVEELDLQNLRLNGVPVLAAPVRELFRLRQGAPIDFPQLRLTVFLRDLRDTAPLRDILNNGSAHLEGQIIAHVQLGFLEKLAVHSMDPTFFFPFSQDVSLDHASDPMERRAALAVLTAVNLARRGGGAVAAHLPSFGSTWAQEAASLAANNLVEVDGTYEMLDERKESHTVLIRQVGFRFGPATALGTAEIADPAAFDPKIQTEIAEHRVSVSAQPILTIHPAPSGNAATGRAVSTTPERAGEPALMRLLANGGRTHIQVCKRATANAFTVLHFADDLPALPGLHAVPAAMAAQDRWPQVAVFRLVWSTHDTAPSVEVVELSAVREGDLIHLSEPLDPSAYGSPILTPNGVLGIVQDQSTGTFLPQL